MNVITRTYTQLQNVLSKKGHNVGGSRSCQNCKYFEKIVKPLQQVLCRYPNEKV
jgi:hypothetical protein